MAAASKARTRPSVAQKPALVRLIVPMGESSRLAPPDQGRVALAVADVLAGQMNGHQRGGASGVQRQARPLQAEGEREPVGGQAQRRAGGGVGVGLGQDRWKASCRIRSARCR